MLTIENLLAAWFQVRAGSRNAGVDGVTLDLFAESANSQLESILYQLLHESYRASPAKGFYVAKKNGGKRLIGIPTVCSYCTSNQDSLGIFCLTLLFSYGRAFYSKLKEQL